MAVVHGAFTQSGYPVVADYSAPELVSNPEVPGTGGVKIYGGLRAGAVATVLLYVAARWHAEVEKLEQVHGVWGYDRRQIRGGVGWSNHAGGCAVDLNASRHPQHARGTFSPSQLVQVRSIFTAVAGAANWGGEWNDASVDEMHAQISDLVADSGAVDSVAMAITTGRLPKVPRELRSGAQPVTANPIPTPDPIPPTPPAAGTYTVKRGDTLSAIAVAAHTTVAALTALNHIADPDVIYPGQLLKLGGIPKAPAAPGFPLPAGCYYGPFEGPAESISGSGHSDARWRPGLARWQQRMRDRGWAIVVDGYYGPQTAAAAHQFQTEKRHTVDGLIDPQTWTAAWTTPIS